MKRVFLLGTTVVAVALTAAVVISSGSAGQQRGVRTISLFAQDSGSSFAFIDNRPLQGDPEEEPLTAGDGFAISQKLFTKEGGARAGTLDATCTAASGGRRPRLNCLGTYGLAGGTIMLQVSIVEGFESLRIAVVGGTGAYEGARGSVTSRQRKNGTIDTIRLLP